MKLIDTDIVIDHFHGHQAAPEYFADNLATGEVLAVSAITLTELFAGMRAGEAERTERLLNLFAVQDVNTSIARLAGRYLNRFRRTHHIELADALIAATAAQLGAELVTRNLKHYPMPDIQVSTPYQRG
jgi:predicted nucleic acid-binding protein